MPQPDLEHDHSPEAIRARLDEGPEADYLGEMVYGALDGAVTTFAVVSSVEGAGLAPALVVVLGLANLLADGFSMGAGSFLGERTRRQSRARLRRMEERHIEQHPEGEREEVRQIFAAKGFDDPALLDRIVDTITADRQRWVDTMLREEHGLPEAVASPWKAGGRTFAAFLAAGALPLLAFALALLWPAVFTAPFALSAAMTAVAFAAIGALKARLVAQTAWVGALEVLLTGAAAAAVAYGVGALLEGLV